VAVGPLRSLLTSEPALAVRGLAFAGRRYTCPCCGAHVRAFTDGERTYRTRATSHCPRCNAKARHRRIWLFLQDRTPLFSRPTRLFEIAPRYAFARRFARMANIRYVAADLRRGPFIAVRSDVQALALGDAVFDALLCVHVLEHVEDDGAAMRELHRILRPGGWALVSVPTDMAEPTDEDASVTDPKERARRFGEEGHVRRYGYDVVKRLEVAGFDVEVDLAADLDPAVVERYGLRLDENLFLCRKAA
jgi:SAM-dependent methyltransferase